MKITLLRGFLFLGALLCFSFVKAQTVSGTVSDATGPLPGASVVVKGTTNGTQTDFDGNYTLNNVSDGAVLVFSYIGYATQEIAYTGQSSLNVTLQEDAQALDEVVIIGYGSTTIKDATGSVAAVTSEDFNAGVIASPEQLIQGKTAGVQITQTSGAPGAGVELRIRGTSSVRSNNNPLFVVDGVPLAGDNTSADATDLGFGNSTASNPLNFLNPSDIESISILKDASATAIYGSRGANGVVIITTKNGRAGSGTFEYSSTLSISTPGNDYDLLGRDEFLDAAVDFNLAVQQGVLTEAEARAAVDAGANTNWQDVATRTVASHNQNLTWSKNYGKGNIRATFGYGDQYGVVENSSLERITGRLNWTHRFLDDKLTISAQTTISRVNEETAPLSATAGFAGDLLGASYSANPTWPNDPTFDPGGNLLNPTNLLNSIQSTSNTNRFLGNISAEYAFTPELKGKVTYGIDTSGSTSFNVINANIIGFTNGTAGNGRGAANDIDVLNNLLTATLNYTKEFENSSLDVLVGYEFQDFGREGRNVQGWGFSTTDLDQMGRDLENSADTIESQISGSFQQYGFGTNSSDIFVNRLVPGDNATEIALQNVGVRALFADTFDFKDELQSFFARVNYTLNNKFLFTGTFRADGSTRFGPDNQYGFFPSGAFAWKLSEEDFIGDNVSTLKVRLNAGITGNQDGLGFGNFVRRERFAAPGGIIENGGNVNRPGLNPVSFANPELKWEETLQYGIGVDFGFNNDRFTGTVDFYRRETSDLLLQTESAQPTPQPFVFRNLPDATNVNQGVEVALSYDFIQTEDFNWNSSINVSYNDNILEDFEGQIPAGRIRGQGLTNAFSQLLAGGQPLFSYFVRQFEEFDSNGQPVFTGGIDNQFFVGEDAIPDFIAGFNTNLSYKNWDLSMFFTGQFGFSIYNNTRNAFFTAGSIANARNVTPDVLTTGESPVAEASVSTFFLEKGDFVRFQNATLGYKVPLSGDGTLKSLRLSVTGQNLFLITDYSGLDPEVSTQTVPGAGINGNNNLPSAGIDYTAFPRPRTFTFGLNATF